MSGEQESTKPVVYIDPEIKDFVPEYLENRKKDSETISDALKQGNFESIRVMGHKMRGSGKLYGFERISEIGYSLEESAKSRNREQIEKLCQQLSMYLEEVEIK